MRVRLMALARDERRLEAVAQLTRASLELWLARPAGMSKLLGTVRSDSGDEQVSAAQLVEARRVGYAVARAANSLPWRPSCLRQGIAVRRMLTRRQIPSRLQLGITRSSSREAHAWVTVHGQPVIGQGALERQVPLATFG